jgi:hypothetical protein
VFRSGYGEWYNDIVWYKGETPETATHWVLVVDDGRYFRTRAEYSFWHTNESEEFVLQCVWTYSHLKKTIRNYLETGKTLSDHNYVT